MTRYYGTCVLCGLWHGLAVYQTPMCFACYRWWRRTAFARDKAEADLDLYWQQQEQQAAVA
jgi:hypothetical protein